MKKYIHKKICKEEDKLTLKEVFIEGMKEWGKPHNRREVDDKS